MAYNESINNLLKELGAEVDTSRAGAETMSAAESRYLKDLKLNVSSVLSGTNLSKKEAYMMALAVAANEKHEMLIKAFEQKCIAEGATSVELAEVHACTSIMNANNILYRFKHYMDDVVYYNNHPAGLRMSVMMNPTIGKQLFEMISLVVSAVNGCERCVVSHESSVKQHGATEPQIYDAIRIGAVIKSLCIVV